MEVLCSAFRRVRGADGDSCQMRREERRFQPRHGDPDFGHSDADMEHRAGKRLKILIQRLTRLALILCCSATEAIEVLGFLQALTILSLNSLLYFLRFLATGGVAEYISMFMD